MNQHLLLCRIALLCLALPLSAAPDVDLERITPVPADQPIPISDFLRPSLLSSPEMNPSGTHISALLTSGEDRHSLIIYDTKTGKTDMASGYGDRDVYDSVWLDDKRLIFGLEAEKLYAVGLFSADIANNRLRVYPILQFCGAYVIGVNEKNTRHPLVWVRRDLEAERDIGVVSVDAGLDTGPFLDLLAARAGNAEYIHVREKNNRHLIKSYPKVEGSGIVTSYLCDKDGQLAFATTSRDGFLTLFRLEKGAWVKCPVDLDLTPIATVGNKPGQLIVHGPGEPGKPRPLQFLDTVTGTLGDIVFHDPAYDFAGSLYRDPATHEVIGVSYQRNGPTIRWFRPEETELQQLLNSSFQPGQIVEIVSRSRVGRRFVISRYSDRQPPIYDWVDLDAKTVGTLKNSRPWIDPQRMQRMQIMQYKTRDGKMLDAYLTLPPGTSKQKPAPLVVLPHGGPYVRDTWGYDGEVQWLASRGYAVLQPNYRGSTSYDWMFSDDDYWDFTKMHQDVTDATKAALATKVIDRTRIAVMGGSFGGYLALAGVSGEPDLYRCAISINGVFDWAAMVESARYYQFDSGQYGWFKRHFGDPRRDPATFEAMSPLRRVDQVKVPVFVAHGKYDAVVEVTQSRALVSALEKHNVPHEALFVGGEGHHLGHLNQRVRIYERIEAFLAKHMKPLPAPANGVAGN